LEKVSYYINKLPSLYAVNACKCAAIIYLDIHHFRRLSLAVEENDKHYSPVFTWCTL